MRIYIKMYIYGVTLFEIKKNINRKKKYFTQLQSVDPEKDY